MLSVWFMVLFAPLKRWISVLAQGELSLSSNQFWSWFIPVNGGGWVYPGSNLSNSHSPARLIHSVLHSCSPSPLASSMSFLVILASSCPSLQTPTLLSERVHHPSSTHALTISFHSPLLSERLFPSNLTSPSCPLFSFSPSVLDHTLLSWSFLKLPSHFPSNTMSHSHITLLILHNSDKPFLSASARTFLSSATPHIPWTSPSQFCSCCHGCLTTTACIQKSYLFKTLSLD